MSNGDTTKLQIGFQRVYSTAAGIEIIEFAPTNEEGRVASACVTQKKLTWRELGIKSVTFYDGGGDYEAE